ncbi:MAG: hypothetical protein NZM04_09700 [Methylacidiphilales bacterium]|nr:hypothetical protein [Candidatus Methylacidiphilales bacterium]
MKTNKYASQRAFAMLVHAMREHGEINDTIESIKNEARENGVSEKELNTIITRAKAYVRRCPTKTRVSSLDRERILNEIIAEMERGHDRVDRGVTWVMKTYGLKPPTAYRYLRLANMIAKKEVELDEIVWGGVSRRGRPRKNKVIQASESDEISTSDDTPISEPDEISTSDDTPISEPDDTPSKLEHA